MTTYFQRKNANNLAYHKIEGQSPGILFLHGFYSDKNGTKSQALQDYCRKTNRLYLSFDHSGHGESEGNFKDGTIGLWLQDALDMIDQFVLGPIICVGSSMGGWIATLASMARPEKIAGLVGLAAAPDFTERLIFKHLTPSQRQELQTQGYTARPSLYTTPYPITQQLIEEARSHLVLDDPINLRIPTHLIHGMRDVDVPWQTSIDLAERLTSTQVKVSLIKSADHRLSSPSDISFIIDQVDQMIWEIENSLPSHSR